MNIRENFDRWMFDYKEGNLTIAEEQAFENFLLNNPEFEADADAWDMAFVSAENVAYPLEEKLERKRRVAGWYYWGAAASLVLLIGSTLIYIFTDKTNLNQPFSKASKHEVVNKFNDYSNNLSSRAEQMLSPFEQTISTQNLNQNNGLSQVDNGVSNAMYSNEEYSITFVNTDKYSIATSEELLNEEIAKNNGSGNISKYTNNPNSSNLSFDVSKKSSVKSGSSRSAFKKFFRKVEKMLGYPPGLTNLRDPELILPQSTVLAFNPSFAGGMLKSKLDINYRNQWLGSDQNSQELNISYDNYSFGLRGGVGFMLNAQDYGLGQFGDYNFSLFYSPKLAVTKNIVIEPSVKMTLGSLNANGNLLNSNMPFEMDRGRILLSGTETQMNGLSTQWYKDFGLGMMVNTKWFYLGFSADNLSQHYENVYGNALSSPSKTPIKVSAIVGTDYKSNKKTMILSPFVAYQQFGNQTDMWGGVNYQQNWFTLGGSVSLKQEFVASVGIKFEGFKLVYHYDFTESMLSGEKLGSHNIGIRFNSKRKTSRLTH